MADWAGILGRETGAPFAAGLPGTFLPGGGLLFGRTRGSAAFGRRIFITGAPPGCVRMALGSVGVAMLTGHDGETGALLQ